jgi:uncharacterized protein
MIREFEIALSPKEASNPSLYLPLIAQKAHVPDTKINHTAILKRSIDARKGNILIKLKVQVFTHDDHYDASAEDAQKSQYQDVHSKKPVAIIGAGPAGLFAALTLIENGLKPVIFERGKDVKERKHDLAALNREHKVNPDSNYCFGEGGAGTYSDGKLYTRSNKRGNVKNILQKLVENGANTDILIDAHPHIGTDKLPNIIASIRQTILDAGGEIYFNTCIEDFELEGNKIKTLIDRSGTKTDAEEVILAIGHSSREMYRLLQKKNILLEAKSFAVGVRAEHPQLLIDQIQYHAPQRNPFLPAASYSLVTQVENRGVFSFCMCPGGIMVPSATADEQLVVNGMSNSQRNSPFANSGIVVSVEPEDLAEYQKFGPLAGLYFQEDIEKAMYIAGGSSQVAPAQRITDFAKGKISADLPKTSYIPGVKSAPLHEILPPFIGRRLQQAFRDFGEKMKGYYTSNGVILGVESRTSSPVRIPRVDEMMNHPQILNLYPCGEGAGYAGGIVSSAMDGVNAALAIVNKGN